jgi:excisionase family DNA binding protein
MQDACEMLDLGRHAVMQLLKDNAIRHFRNGRAIRISVESMRQWLRSLADPGSSSIA